jgi:nitrogen fixation NifU-like protein
VLEAPAPPAHPGREGPARAADGQRAPDHVVRAEAGGAARGPQEQAGAGDVAQLAGLRGQLAVMLVMAAFYAIALSLVGVEYAVAIGLLTGLITFIPYLGALFMFIGQQDDIGVGTGMVGAPACGDVMKLQIKVNPATGLIEDARFKTYGCGSAIASSSLVTEWVKGKSLDEAMTIKNTQIAEELALPPVKIHCSILAEDAIKAAVEDYKQKHGATATAAATD